MNFALAVLTKPDTPARRDGACSEVRRKEVGRRAAALVRTH